MLIVVLIIIRILYSATIARYLLFISFAVRSLSKIFIIKKKHIHVYLSIAIGHAIYYNRYVECMPIIIG